MSTQTSLISVYLLFALVYCTFGLNAAEKWENSEKSVKSEMSNLLQRLKRQFNGNNFDGFNGAFGGDRRRSPFFQNNPNNFAAQRPFNSELIFSVNPRQDQIPNSETMTSQNSNNNNNNSNDQSNQLVFINNRPTIATMAPFTGRTTASPQYLTCFNSCRTTSEYNPICGSDQELYFNEQKFNCARSCGADIQIVRRGSCQGLFPMMRG